jgi:pilus assembly protein Flp/PilA
MIVLRIRAFIQRFTDRDDEDGQGLAEYALILALIAIVAIVALIFLGSQISNKLSVIVATVISFGRRRSSAPSVTASTRSAYAVRPAAALSAHAVLR